MCQNYFIFNLMKLLKKNIFSQVLKFYIHIIKLYKRPAVLLKKYIASTNENYF